MRIGILQTAYKKASDYGTFYNVQELGLARALAKLGNDVILYKAVEGEADDRTECDGKLTIKLLNVWFIGINGIIDTKALSSDLDVLIYFCDTQIKVPAVYKWCRKNGVKFFPYVGVIESHSEIEWKRRMMMTFAMQNLKVFRKCTTFAKTTDVVNTLVRMGCNDVVTVPVGLDETVLCRQQRGGAERNVSEPEILYIGRMEEEKKPLEMVAIYEKLLETFPSLRLTMIGDGYLYGDVKKKINQLIADRGIDESRVALYQKIPYDEMHEYYCKASAYINLNRVEILGMSILESFYYGCPVAAVRAPGPESIFKRLDEKFKMGRIVDEDENGSAVVPIADAVADILKTGKICGYEADYEEIAWNKSAAKIMEIIAK